MRVLLLTDADGFTDVERHILDLAQGLRAEGVECWIASPSPTKLQEKAAGARLRHLPLPKGGLAGREAVRILTRMFRSEEIDIVHAHSGKAMIAAVTAMRRAKKGRVIASQHFLTPDHSALKGPKAVVYRTTLRWCSRRTNHFVAVSEAVRSAMLARREAPKRKITVVPNGISPIDKTGLTAPERVRADLQIAKNAPLVVCVAPLEPEQDVSALIEAMEGVNLQIPRAVCLIAGTGSQQEELAQQIVEFKQEETVRLLGFPEDVPALIGSADLFVLPSVAEPFGLALLEAMALSKPVIAMQAGGPMEIVVDNSTGLLTPPADPDALAEAIGSLLTDRPTLQMMGNRGYTRFLDEFTAKRMSREMLRVYERALQAKPGG